MEEEEYEIKLHPDAVKAIEQIYFITAEVSLSGAAHVVDDIYDAVYALSKNPERFQYDVDIKSPYRRVLVRQYKILFIIDERLKQVMILLVWNTKRSPAKLKWHFKKK